LIELARDTRAPVRRWAVFGLGWTTSREGSRARQALLAATQDPDDEVTGEAFIGLALRGDKRVVPLLREYLQSSGFVGTLAVQAAKEIADPSLIDALVALREWWDADVELLEEAIRVSRG
jgi:HEAT repeat protein